MSCFGAGWAWPDGAWRAGGGEGQRGIGGDVKGAGFAPGTARGRGRGLGWGRGFGQGAWQANGARAREGAWSREGAGPLNRREDAVTWAWSMRRVPSLVGVPGGWAWSAGVSGVSLRLSGACGGRVPGKQWRSPGPGAPSGTLRGPRHRESRWGCEAAWGVPPGTSPSRGSGAGGVPEDPHPHGPLSAPDSFGKGREPSRAMAPVEESVPVSPSRILSPTPQGGRCPAPSARPSLTGGTGPSRCVPRCCPLPPGPFSCSRSAAGSRGWAGGKPGLAPSAAQKTAPKSPLSSPKPPSCCVPSTPGGRAALRPAPFCHWKSQFNA